MNRLDLEMTYIKHYIAHCPEDAHRITKAKLKNKLRKQELELINQIESPVHKEILRTVVLGLDWLWIAAKVQQEAALWAVKNPEQESKPPPTGY
jgi:hypothetical protein